MLDIEKVKNLLIKLDLKYKATKDQINMNGIILLFNFDKEYKEFNTINALDVLNNLENKLAITEKALELASEFNATTTCSGQCLDCCHKEICDSICNLYNKPVDYANYFKTKAKEMLENGQ